MLWAALLPEAHRSPDSPRTDALLGLAVWCLQFTPRVAIEGSAVLMEVEGSERLFGGKRALAAQVREESAGLGVAFLAWAPTSLAALALARCGVRNGFAQPLPVLLDALPLESLAAVAAHAPMLKRLGCTTLGQVRALPRGGLSRRFDKELLVALDQAYGLRPSAYAWVALPEQFHARLELMSRVEHAPAILFGARRLLLQLCAWLAARRCGVTAFTLRWCHDAMRSKTAGDGGELTIRTAEPTRSIENLARLLAENLAKVQLFAPVGDLELLAVDVRAFEAPTASLLPDSQEDGESLALVLERIAARLGPERVLRPVPQEDHRLEWAVHWQAASVPMSRNRAGVPAVPYALPQPSFVLPQSLPLAVQANRPLYQGTLQLLSGPHRIEGGWWHRLSDETGTHAQTVVRDYWVALSAHAGVLWIYQTRLANEDTAWFLHGIFA
ncbi:MAG: DNA polymerase Y family protein [Rhodoferax sp.]|uniref:Y-family DNA polymerase n=1 Tax=Rhodoferax sp. TaxID=50421 RepID=UPI003263D461